MKKPKSTDELEDLKHQLQRVRQQSLTAVRRDDFREVARLTAETARLNRAIHCQEEFSDCVPTALALVDSLANDEISDHFVFPDSILDDATTELCEDAA